MNTKETNDPTASEGLSRLRRQAEAVARDRWADNLTNSGETLSDLSPKETQRLFHELTVHQIELEMQNEELRRAHLELESSRDAYADLYDFAPVGYITSDEQGIITEANLTVARLLSVDRTDLVGSRLSKFIVGDNQDIYYLHRRRLLATRAPQACELRLTRDGQDEFWVHIEENIAQGRAGQVVYRATMNDITERVRTAEMLRASTQRVKETLAELREAQERMMHQERLAVVGQLSAGIAHDFNNILAAITLYTQMSLLSDELTSTLRKRLETIREQTDHATDLVQQILDFGGRTVLQRSRVELEPLLERTVALLARTLPESVRIDVALGDDNYVIDADPTRVQQVIINLAQNARDAMPDGGKLHIALSGIEGEGFDCVSCGRVVGGTWVRLVISDTGWGIPPDVLPHIFEPFFTTRAPLGHGLGLAQVYGIVKQHEGHIQVETQVGQGTTFKLYWPAVPAVQPPIQTPDDLQLAPGEAPTLLLVEDNAATRAALADVFVMLGYRVLEAPNGEEALRICEAQADEISLVVSDWIMPSMGGMALLQEMEARHSALKVLVLTGHPIDEATRSSMPERIVGWAQKPLSLNELAATVAQALAKSV